MGKKFFGKLTALALAIVLVWQVTPAAAVEKSDDVVILFTNDVHCSVGDAETFGYANVSAYRKKLLETHNYVALVDAGDHIQGDVYGVLSKGLWITEIMNACGYDYSAVGNHEFDYQISGLENVIAAAECEYLSCNLIEIETGESMLAPYAIEEYGDIKVAFIGITTPEAFTKSNPTYFKNEDGEFIYSFCQKDNGRELYEKVQATIDEVRDEVDYVIALGHLGVDSPSSPWTSRELIANTHGIDVFIDGHSHTFIESENVTDSDGCEVILAQTGTRFVSFGLLTIAGDGTITAESITAEEAPDRDEAVIDIIEGIEAECADELNVVAGTSDINLYISDPDTGIRLIRKQETNAGDFVADAYRIVSGADIAVVNGGGIRVDIPAGEITVGILRSLHPFGNELCVVRTSGQNILDLLEMSVSKLDENGEGENGGFQHVSGLIFTADATIPSPVIVSEEGELIAIEGERRVRDVMVLDSETGEYTPLDPEGEYTMASHNYMIKDGGDGLNMFMDDELLIDGMCIDYQVVMQYFDLCGGSVPEEYSDINGQGRITIITSDASAATQPDAVLPQTGVVAAATIYAIGAMLIGSGAVLTRRNRREEM